jgi:hypothetical protein
MPKQLPKILEKFKLKEALPSIILSGARDNNRGKLLAGVARAAFRSDAVILDSGVASGIENYCLRRSKQIPYLSNFNHVFRGQLDRCIPRK